MDDLLCCGNCSKSFDTDVGLLKKLRNRLPVSCRACEYTICHRCYKSEIVGEWKVELEEGKRSSFSSAMSCPSCEAVDGFDAQRPHICHFACQLIERAQKGATPTEEGRDAVSNSAVAGRKRPAAGTPHKIREKASVEGEPAELNQVASGNLSKDFQQAADAKPPAKKKSKKSRDDQERKESQSSQAPPAAAETATRRIATKKCTAKNVVDLTDTEAVQSQEEEPVANKKTLNDEIIFDIRDEDILSGKEKHCVSHPGSIELRATIDRYASSYQEAVTKQEKMALTLKIYTELGEQNGRFLKWNAEAKGWEELSSLLARDKISHALRRPIAMRQKQPRKNGNIHGLGHRKSSVDKVQKTQRVVPGISLTKSVRRTLSTK